MKKATIVLGIIMVLAIAAPSHAIVTWDFLSAYGNGGYTSPYATADVVTFDAALPAGWALTGNYQITTGTATDAAAPWWDNFGVPPGAHDLTDYLSVPSSLSEPETTRTATLSFGGSFNNYFGLWWGSMDTYNKFEFLAADLSTPVETVFGTTFSSGSGNQNIADTNKFVNFYGLPSFYGVRLTSTNFALEVDNIAVGLNVVPEPLTVILLGCGLLGLLGVRRKLS